MSKSYGNYKTVGICTGTNTEFYHDRRVRVRRKNKSIIRNIIANKPIDEFDDSYNPYKEPKNKYWLEPTDGTWKVKSKDSVNFKNIYKVKNKNKIKK